MLKGAFLVVLLVSLRTVYCVLLCTVYFCVLFLCLPLTRKEFLCLNVYPEVDVWYVCMCVCVVCVHVCVRVCVRVCDTMTSGRL